LHPKNQFTYPLMKIDLKKLREMHPELPGDVAVAMLVRAGLALQRNGHATGVAVSLRLERAERQGSLSWRHADINTIGLHDDNRITEDGAEAVTLAVFHKHFEWRVVRRMQREEHADWLLERTADAGRETAALEVSGVDRGSIASRLREKLGQVAKSSDVDQRWAGVVGFERPIAALESKKRGKRAK
jgi:hypothetical protein